MSNNSFCLRVFFQRPLTILALMFFGGLAGAADPQAPAFAKDLAFVKQGMKKTRTALTSAIVKAELKIYTVENRQPKIASTAEFTVAFDGAHKLRFDRKGPGLIPLPLEDPATDPTNPFKKVPDFRSRLYKNHSHYAVCTDNSTTVVADHPKSFNSGLIDDFFDPKAIGLYTGDHFITGTTIDQFDDLFFGRPNQLTNVSKTDDGIWTFTFHSIIDGTPHKVMAEVNVNEGFSPRLIEIAMRDKNDYWSMTEQAKTKWAKVNDQWVPVESEITSQAGYKIRNVVLNWSSVNVPLPDSQFSLEALEIPKHVHVARMENGRLIMIRTGQRP